MKKFILATMLLVSIAASAKVSYQYFYACGAVWGIDANLTKEQVAAIMDVIESDCP